MAHDIAIIGYGFSGLMVLSNLVREASTPLNIAVFDPSTHRIRGAAYSTDRLEHLLNVRANRMGAFADAPDGFFQWLQSANGQDALCKRSYAETVSELSFVPRCIYGDYLESIYHDTLAAAQQKSIVVTFISEEVEAIIEAPGGYELTAAKKHHVAQKLVIAGGNNFKASSQESTNLINPLEFDYTALQNSSESIAVIGMGLTAVDTIMSLLQAKVKGKIYCISRNGKFPHAHHDDMRLPSVDNALESLKTGTLSHRMQALRTMVREAKKQGYLWHSVIDALRPYTVLLWQSLPIKERKRFLSRAFTWWNIHRHRMAGNIAQELSVVKKSGQLETIQGKYESYDGSKLIIKQRQGARKIPVRHVFGCMGFDTARIPPCLSRLIDLGIVHIHPTGAGVVEQNDLRISRLDAAPIYALGSVLLGERLETVAVPELRFQAAGIAKQLLA